MSASSFFSGMGFRKLVEMLIPLCNNLVTGRVFPTWKNSSPLCAIGTYWYHSGNLYQAIKESGTTSVNGAQSPTDGLLYWQKVNFSPLGLSDDETLALTELNNLRQASIGRPQWATSTTPPVDHVLVNGDFISFASRPEFKAKYDAGGFAGLLMPYNADAATQAANKGMFRPDAAVPTGLYLPVDGGAYYQAWTASANGTAGAHLTAGLPNTQGWTGVVSADGTLSGPFYKGSASYGVRGLDYYSAPGIFFDPSRVSGIFGNSTTVTPDTIKRPVIMYLGRSDKVLNITATTKTWAATVALDNLSLTGTRNIAKMAAPTKLYSRRVNLAWPNGTPPATGWVYTAPSAGDVCIMIQAAVGSWYSLIGYADDNVTKRGVATSNLLSTPAGNISASISVAEGQKVGIAYTAPTLSELYFIPKEGA